ncbi:hypothetical protein F0562_016442 [Nyssa sinensis]|uniref:Uncharacterized protein n=1 Tax=Nyssa sinensis TaxID=561372 RepID=A0A5J4ZLY4_9ASTE|nr:hypothetical protein F0562_016442 [Nyssa sinensis]
MNQWARLPILFKSMGYCHLNWIRNCAMCSLNSRRARVWSWNPNCVGPIPNSMRKKLNSKHLKDCVNCNTEFSLATASDEESEAQVEGEKNSEEYYEKKMGPESKKSVVGMKRAMDFE